MRDSSKYPRLNLPPVKLRVEQRGKDLFVWDELRGRFLLLTPEEWVRRHVMGFLCSCCGADKHNLAQEYPVNIGGMPQRADILWISPDGSPFMLVECKAPDTAVDTSVFSQAVRYNSVLKAGYIMITNGLSTRFFKRMPNGEYEPQENFPFII